MKSRRLFLSCAFCICVAGAASSARGQGTAFDPKMSLEETLAWLGKHLTHQDSVASTDGKYIKSVGISLVKAKGCTLSYSITRETEALDRVSPVSSGYQVRERWVLDLSALNPTMIGADSGRVHFMAAAWSHDAIRTTIFRNEKFSGYTQKKSGYLSVPEKVAPEEVAAGLRHAIELCRQRKQ